MDWYIIFEEDSSAEDRSKGTIDKKNNMILIKSNCEKCSIDFSPKDKVYSCSYNCTYCVGCSVELKYICPNCSGQLSIKNDKIQ